MNEDDRIGLCFSFYKRKSLHVHLVLNDKLILPGAIVSVVTADIVISKLWQFI